MQLTQEFQPIRDWAEEKGIYAKGDIKTQTLKLLTEVGELGEAMLDKNQEEIEDAIGDCVVVLTSIAKFAGVTIEQCINGAYGVISKRTGSMQNGTFVKD